MNAYGSCAPAGRTWTGTKPSPTPSPRPPRPSTTSDPRRNHERELPTGTAGGGNSADHRPLRRGGIGRDGSPRRRRPAEPPQPAVAGHRDGTLHAGLPSHGVQKSTARRRQKQPWYPRLDGVLPPGVISTPSTILARWPPFRSPKTRQLS